MSDMLSQEMALLRNLKVLGLGGDASLEDAERAYEKLRKVWDPDRFQDDEDLRVDAERKLAEVQAAFEHLPDAIKRRDEERRKDWQTEALEARAEANRTKAELVKTKAALKEMNRIASLWKAEAEKRGYQTPQAKRYKNDQAECAWCGQTTRVGVPTCDACGKRVKWVDA
ncbi:MAG: DnaJ domain-containing protein [Coriobacteriia bacterium]|nr:DnaJ domain-containing protein [Coriobacteriia bacterium]